MAPDFIPVLCIFSHLRLDKFIPALWLPCILKPQPCNQFYSFLISPAARQHHCRALQIPPLRRWCQRRWCHWGGTRFQSLQGILMCSQAEGGEWGTARSLSQPPLFPLLCLQFGAGAHFYWSPPSVLLAVHSLREDRQHPQALGV